MFINLPFYIVGTFILTTCLTLWFIFRIIKKSAITFIQEQAAGIIAALVIWLIIQAGLSLTGVYSKTTAIVPPLILAAGIFPAILIILWLLITPLGKKYTNSFSLAGLTWLHVIRVPVELVLFGLFVHKKIPEIMTFEGRNFDILAGITAPAVVYFGIMKKRLSNNILLGWNIGGLILLLNIVVHAFLSAPSPLQQLAFHQPNIAILYFPFSWLPVFIVPVVAYCHIASIRQLVKRNR